MYDGWDEGMYDVQDGMRECMTYRMGGSYTDNEFSGTVNSHHVCMGGKVRVRICVFNRT